MITKRRHQTKIKSPYVILNLQRRSNPSKDEIKSQFRALAKMYHPDLNPNTKSNAEKMIELVSAYDSLLKNECDDFEYARLGSNKLATMCELYTLQELRSRSSVSIFPIRVNFENQISSSSNAEDNLESVSYIDDSSLKIDHVFPITCHSEDSIYDVKCFIMNKHSSIMFSGRSTTWELFFQKENGEENIVMSYHLFLHSYGVSDGDILYVIVENID